MYTTNLKRFFSLVLAVLMVISLVPTQAFAEETHDHSHEQTGDVTDHEHEEHADGSETEGGLEGPVELQPAESIQVIQLRMKIAEYIEKYQLSADMSDAALTDVYRGLLGELRTEARTDIDAMLKLAEGLSKDEQNKLLDEQNSKLVQRFYVAIQRADAFSVNATTTLEPISGVSVAVETDDPAPSMTDGVITVTATGKQVDAGCDGTKDEASTATITIANSSGKKGTLTFAWAKVSGVEKLTIDGETNTDESGSVNVVLEANGTVVIKVTSGKGPGATATFTISGFALAEVQGTAPVTVVYDSTLGSVTVDGAAVASGEAKEVLLSGTTLVATPVDGARVVGWVDSENKILTHEATYQFAPEAATTVKAVFAKDGGNGVYLAGTATSASVKFANGEGISGAVMNAMATNYQYQKINGTHIFESFNDAMSCAASSASKYVVLMNNTTLPAGTYTVPAGVTLLIPFDNANSLYTTQSVPSGVSGTEAIYATPTPYRTLTLANGANLVIDGAVSLSAQHTLAQGSRLFGGAPTGNVSFVRMEGNSAITVNNGGSLYAYGFITGSGSVTVNSGAKVYELFQITDFRGGTQSTSMDKGVFPLSQYYVQNIEVPMTIYAGATEYSYTSIYMSSCAFGSSVAFIGGKECMFYLENGYVVKQYDGTTDRLVVDAYGNLTVSPIDMQVGTTSINSAQYDLGINGNITVTVHDATITLGQDIALLPGAEIIVTENATCKVGTGINVYVYDFDEWKYYDEANGVWKGLCGPLDYVFIPVMYAPGQRYTRTEADLVDAKIEVNGYTDASAGFIYTTAGGAAVVAGSDGAQVNIKPGTQTVTNQLLQTTGQYVDIPITSAKLQNADGTYVETTEEGTYTFLHGVWHKPSQNAGYTVETVEPTCRGEGSSTYTCGCGYSYSEVLPAVDHKGREGWPTCTEAQLCVFCDLELKPAKGHSQSPRTVEGREPDCTNPGWIAYYQCPDCEAYFEDSACTSPITDLNAWRNGNGYLPVNSEKHVPGEKEAIEDGRVNATCIATGSHFEVVLCTLCGKELSRETVTDPMIDHSYSSKVTKEATCTATGVLTYNCTTAGCTASYTETIDMKPHTSNGVVPDCTNSELCSECGAVMSPALGHQAGEGVRENEDPVTGIYELVTYCSVCGAEMSRRAVVPGGESHNIVYLPAKAPTCTETGLSAGAYCSDEGCTYKVEQQVTPAKGHTLEGVQVTYTWNDDHTACTVSGFCTVCGEPHSIVSVSAETTEIPATCDNDGKIIYTATFAETYLGNEGVYTTEVKGAGKLNHAWGDAEYTWSEDMSTCTAISICGNDPAHVRQDNAKIDAVVTAPTCETAGYTTYYAVFSQTWTENQNEVGAGAAATGHSWKITSTNWGVDAEGNVTCSVALECEHDASHVKANVQGTVAETAKTEPTCTAVGSVTYTASFDEGFKIGSVEKTETLAALGHGWSEVSYTWSDDHSTCTALRTCVRGCEETETVESSSTCNATCTAAGTTTYTVDFQNEAFLNQTETVDTAALGHTMTTVAAVEATCQYAGNNEYYICSVCKGVYKDVDGNVTTTKSNEVIPVQGHKYTTYTSNGDATCLADGTKTASCDYAAAGCSETSTVSDTGSRLAHLYTQYQDDENATCLADGTETAYCDLNCGTPDTRTVVGSKLEHEYVGVVTQDPTCTEEGVETFTCKNGCNGSYTKDVPATGHSHNAEVTQPTCVAQGYTTYTCHCGDTYKGNYVNANGHTYDEGQVTVAATCVANGVMTYTCTVCEEGTDGYTKNETIPSPGHNYDKVVTPPTCTEKGYTTYTCTVCNDQTEGYRYVSDYTDATGHGYVGVVTNPTCIEEGYTTYTCTKCDDSYTDDTVAALGHKDENTDHACDNGCDVYQGEHLDSDKNHICDYGCSEAIGDHVDVETDQDHLCEYCDQQIGDHVFVEGICNCGYVQDLNVSLVIKATGTNDVVVPQNTIKYGTTYSYTLDLSVFGNCYIVNKVVVTVNGVEITNSNSANTELVIDGANVTGDIEIVVTAIQSHTIGAAVAEGYVAPTCTEDGKVDMVIYCANCNALMTKTTTVLPSGGHKYQEVYTDPTFDADGFWTYTCKNFGCDHTYTVTDEGTRLIAVAKIGDVRFESLEEAIAAAVAGDTITLLQKIVVEGQQTWNLEGITLQIADVGYDYGLTVRGELTVEDGTFVVNGFYGVGVTATGKLTVNGGSFSITADNDYLIGSYGTVVINGGTFAGQYNCVNGFAGTVTVNGGIFSTAAVDSTGEYESEDVLGATTVTGGTFSKDVSAYLAEGYCQKVDGNAYVVGQHVGGEVQIENAVQNTCTVDGSHDEVVYCTHGGEEISRVSLVDAAPGHNEVIDEKVDETCTTSGLTEGKHCDVCGEVMVAQEVRPALNHNYVASVTKAATCENAGVRTYTCSNDSNHTYTEEIPALGHAWNVTYNWNDDFTGCSAVAVCGNNANHKVTGVAVVTLRVDLAATCENDGVGTQIATFTGDVFTTQEQTVTLEELGHSYTTYTSNNDATCTDDGTKTASCDNGCGTKDTVVDTGSAKGHTMTLIEAHDATCTTDGNNAYFVCGVCGNAYKDNQGKEPTSADAEKWPQTGHNYQAVVTSPTCVDRGYTTHTCANGCGSTYVDSYVDALGHSYDTGVITTPPTCTEAGVKTYTCGVCTDGTTGHTKTESVKELGHTVVTDAYVAATCTTAGKTEGSHCSACGHVIVAQNEIPAKGHNKNLTTIRGKDPTCTDAGYKACYQCPDCKVYFEDSDCTIVIADLAAWQTTGAGYLTNKGHAPAETVVENKVAPTCTEDGSHDEVVYCSVCGVELSREKIVDAAKGHTDVEIPAKAPTCTETGLTAGTKCSVCGAVTKAQEVVAAKGHNEVIDPAVESTCTKTGLTEGSHCDVCGEVIKVQTPTDMKSHALALTKLVEETCTEDGSELWTCSDCGHEVTEVRPAKGHTEVDVPAKAPTCTASGLTAGKQCSVCHVFTVPQEEIANTGHSYVSVVTPPTCTTKGYTTRTCSVCGDVVIDTYVNEAPHTEVTDPAVPATCTETGLTEGKHCSVCGTVLLAQKEIPVLAHTTVIDAAVPATCTETGLTEGEHCSVCGTVTKAQEVVPAKGHIEVVDEAVEPTCTKTGLTEGKHCSVCNEVLVAQEVVPVVEHTWNAGRVTTAATCVTDGVRTFTCSVCMGTKTETIAALGHDLVQHAAKLPTYASIGWDAYEECIRDGCGYTTYKEIPAMKMSNIKDFDTFMENLQILENLAASYAKANPGKDPLMLVIKYIRTGVDRYNSGSWNIMAGYEDKGFAEYVAKYEETYNQAAASIDEMITVTSLKNINNFRLPNGDLTDIGHMFGTMDISYTNSNSVNHADVAGWGGDLADLLSLTDQFGVTGSVEEMVEEITADYFLRDTFPVKPIEGTFSETDLFGDLDGFYIMQQLYAQEYTNGTLYNTIAAYMTENLTNEYRVAFFLKNRLGGVSSISAIRDAVYTEYMGNQVIATLEATRVYTSENLSDLRRACCYTFADYLCKLAGDYVEAGDHNYFNVFSTEVSTLAPGITQEINLAETADNKQIRYYLATADLTSEYVHIYANYKDNDPSLGWGMSRVRDQANAAQARHGDPNSPLYIENYNVIAAINGAGYNMSTGEPAGLLVMGGVEYHQIDGNGFFGILDDGTPVIGTTAEYNGIYAGRVMEGIAGFGTVLIKDGKIQVGHSDTYTNDRASRTAVGITKTGKVVFMVLDGRQEPVSCGGSMQEIAQIMQEAGCIHAINLDGGGSTTYVAKQEGADELSLVSSPSDGFERSVATSLIMVSTAPSSTAFDHAVLEAKPAYLTVGSSVQITATGVSPMGNAAEIPEGTTWTVANSAIGTITEDGVFTGIANGNVDVYLMLGDQIVGTITMHVVVPDALYFSKENLDTVYGAKLELPIVALYEGKKVAINNGDVGFVLSNPSAGVIEGMTFIGDEASGIKTVTVTAVLAQNHEITANAKIVLYKQGEASFDFDQATGGDRILAWDRQVSNSTTKDSITYMVENVGEDMVTSYIFAIDMTQIPIPEQLADLTYMLPGADVEGASAWTFLLQLAERVSVLTEVTPVIHFDENMIVDYSNLTIVNEYFELQENGVEFDEETNSLILHLRWIDQTQAIDPATANPLCILSGIKLTPKDDAAWNANSRLDVVNNGEIGYKIYLRANALYTFAQSEENQKKYNLYPFVNPDLESEKGAYYESIYATFEDNYTLVNSTKNGWVFEDGGYAYYENGEKYYGIRLVDGYYYDFGEDGINYNQEKYTGLFEQNGKTCYAKNGVLVTGWLTLNGEKYCFDENGMGYHGTVVVDEVELLFENGKLVGGHTGFIKKSDGKTYHYVNGEQTFAWFWDGTYWYHFDATTGVMVTGTKVQPDAETKSKGAYYDFDDEGRLLRAYFNPAGYYYWAGLPKADSWVKNGWDSDPDAWYRTNGNGHYVTDPRSSAPTVRIEVDGVVYTFDNTNGKLLKGDVVNDNGTLYYYWAGEPLNDGWYTTIDGDTYYAYPDGHLAVGKVEIDGESYLFSNAGVLMNEAEEEIETTPMYRLYNPNSGEHFYTGSIEERDMLVDAGWHYEGVAWNAPVKEGAPVYRLYNPNSGDHHYTMSADERDWLVSLGWKYEGVAWNSATPSDIPQFRLYNPNADVGSHHYTSSVEERDYLVSLGWIYEGIGWFGTLK